jgi:hypothetical protein
MVFLSISWISFLIDVIACDRWTTPGIYDVEYLGAIEAIVIYDIADVLIIRSCYNFDDVIKYFLGAHIVYIGMQDDRELTIIDHGFDLVTMMPYNKTKTMWIFKKNIEDVTDYETM